MTREERIKEFLSEKEYNVLRYRTKDNLTLKKIGEIYGVSKERIRQIEAKAYRKLRHPSARRKLNIQLGALWPNATNRRTVFN